MMKRISRWVCSAALGLALVGCGRNPADEPIPSSLTVEQWKKLPASPHKYDPATFELLKKSDPKLKNRKNWERFFKTVIVPHRKKDIP